MRFPSCFGKIHHQSFAAALMLSLLISNAAFASSMVQTMYGFVGELQSLYKPINIFCYIAGAFLGMRGITRLINHNPGPQSATSFGTWATFFTCGALLSMPHLLASVTNSFGMGDNYNNIIGFSRTNITDEDLRRNMNLIVTACVTFIQIVGVIAFIRGFFVLRAVADGNSQVSPMAGFTHIIGGALAVNLGPLIMVIMNSLGMTGYVYLA